MTILNKVSHGHYATLDTSSSLTGQTSTGGVINIPTNSYQQTYGGAPYNWTVATTASNTWYTPVDDKLIKFSQVMSISLPCGADDYKSYNIIEILELANLPFINVDGFIYVTKVFATVVDMLLNFHENGSNIDHVSFLKETCAAALCRK